MSSLVTITPLQQRLHGPVLSELTANSLFAGDAAKTRMDALRNKITEVRSIWHTADEYHRLVQRLQHHIYNENQSAALKEQIGTLLSTYHDWADFPCERPQGANSIPWAFIELYASSDGHTFLFSLFNEVLRMQDADEDKLLTAAFLTEIITIELYNLRLSNIGDPIYANYQGKVFRGLGVQRAAVEHFWQAATKSDLTKRTFSIPLGFMSSTTARTTMEKFAKQDPGLEEMFWIIHIHGLEPELLRRYEERYPESVVTSICAMPIARIAEYGEREILLRGAWFQIIGMRTENRESGPVHTVEMAMLNTNRDHGTEHALHTGHKKAQREYFNDIIRASRYKICASLAKSYSMEESKTYEKLEQEMLKAIQTKEHKLNIASTATQWSNVLRDDLANSWSGSVAVWIGDSEGRSFPRHHLSKRRSFHDAAKGGDWIHVQETLKNEYHQRRVDWFNITELSDTEASENGGRTLLHELAFHGPPPPNDISRYTAWQYIIETMSRGEVWRTLRDNNGDTAEAIALAQNHSELVPLMTPVLRHVIPDNTVALLQKKLHDIITKYAQSYIDGLAFRMPELSVLMELERPQLWIPTPGMFGGFFVTLEEHTLGVKLYHLTAGKVKSQQKEFRLEADGPPIKLL